MTHTLERWAIAAVRGCARVLPQKAVLAAGSLLGWLFYALDRSHRQVALGNLEQCFPSRAPRERRRIARRMFGHFGRLLFEILRYSALGPEALTSRVQFEGEERVWNAYARGRGVLFFTGHFGFWELQAIAHGVHFRPIGVLARALDNPALNDLLERFRGATGNTVIYRQGAVRRVLRTLAGGDGVALLIDQHMHSPDAIWVDFFERPAATTSTLAALALRTGAAVIPVFALPVENGCYRLIYEPAVQMPAADAVDPVRELTQRCTDVLEMYVRKHPELWLWMHRRWRDAPVPAGTGMFPAIRADEDA